MAEILLKRGELIVQNAQHEIQQFVSSGHGHLVQAFEHEVVLVEALNIDLKHQIEVLNRTHEVHHLHAIEEELLHRENRLAEELSIIKEVQANHHAKGHSRAQLIANGEALIKKAAEAVAKQPNTREAKAIQAESAHVQQLIAALKGKPETTDLKNEEQQLDRHETTLDLLLVRLRHQAAA